MADDWVLDVLTDLTDFARRNDLPALAVELERTTEIARRELAGRLPVGEDGSDRLNDGPVSAGS